MTKTGIFGSFWSLVPKPRKEPEAGDKLKLAFEEAEPVVKYLLQSGVALNCCEFKAAAQIYDVLNKIKCEQTWSAERSSELFTAITVVNRKASPVTAATLRRCMTGKVLKWYWRGAFLLALIVICLSILSFVTTGIANSISADTRSANELAVRMVAQIGEAGEGSLADGAVPGAASPTAGQGVTSRILLTDLQQFAAETRLIYRRANQLNCFIPNLGIFSRENNQQIRWDRLQLPVPLDKQELQKVAPDMVQNYQVVREFADMVRGQIELFYGSLGTIVLPILYALLGAYAHLLRRFSREVRELSYVPSYADRAQLLLAMIGGTVVGLFNNFIIGQGTLLPPLAIAFLVGYAINFFFTYLDGLVERTNSHETGVPTAQARNGAS
jgi:hypothetical protein